MTDNGQKIIDLDRKRMNAMAQKDFATLNALLSDDLVYTHSTARLDTKKSLIEAMESGRTVYTGVEPSDVKAQDLGNAVVLTGSARIHVMSNGKPNSFGVRFTDVYWSLPASRLPAFALRATPGQARLRLDRPES